MVLTEVIARVLKHLLCARYKLLVRIITYILIRWRALRSNVDLDYTRCAQEFFTQVFSAGDDSATFWEEQLPSELASRFECEHACKGI